MKKRISVKKIISLIVVLAIIFSIFKYVSYINSSYYKLKVIGYNNVEITTIMDSLNKDELKVIIDKKLYNDKLSNLLKEKYFLFKNLDRYLSYENKKNYKLSDLVAVVNTNNDSEFYTNIKETDTKKNELMLVNKFNHLSKTYKPTAIVDMSSQYAYLNNKILESTYRNFIELCKSAKASGFTLVANSSFRTYETQEALYNTRVDSQGIEKADSYAARPGHSEHQTGYAIDINEYGMGSDDFSSTDSYQWLINNSYKYGFILRYPEDKEFITGYSFEAWHFRYVGIPTATKIHKLNITFDEYYAFFIDGAK